MNPGTVVADRYEILALIGKGGMGQVYKARHREIGRLVAIKVLNSGPVADERTQRRFHQEATAMAALMHPHVTSVNDYGKMPDGSHFIVMEYLEGQTLAELLKQHRQLQDEMVVSLTRQLVGALGYAHLNGVVHRDLKPANLMILSQTCIGFIKVMDFGIAKILAPESESLQALTEPGEVFGSPLYMSPEQCAGRHLDGRSDIYSVGCIMYELLTGIPPMKGINPVQTIVKHMQERPKSFSEVRPDLGIDRELEAVVLRCMEKDPNNRFQTMLDVCEALRNWQESREANKLRALYSEQRGPQFMAPRPKTIALNSPLANAPIDQRAISTARLSQTTAQQSPSNNPIVRTLSQFKLKLWA